MNTYDVAIWRYWPTEEFPLIAEVQAEAPYEALFSLMQAHHVKKAAYTAVRCSDGTVRRWPEVAVVQEVEL
jgi:hypothetical protein